MHVGLYHHQRLPIRGYGGTERVVVWLARGLMELGHRVTLLAAPGSDGAGAAIVPVDPRELARHGYDLTAWLPADLDVLHAHTPLRTAPACPHFVTIHGNARSDRRFPAGYIFTAAL